MLNAVNKNKYNAPYCVMCTVARIRSQETCCM